MNIFKDMINEKGADLIATLRNSGFDANTARRFLGEAGGDIGTALTSGQVDLNQGSAQDKTNAVIGNIDIAALASKVGIDSSLAMRGLNAITPLLLNMLQNKFGDLSGIAGLLGGAEKAGGLFNMAKKFF